MRPATSASVSVIVPVWNEAGRLAGWLDDLSREPGVREIIVADGGSRDGSTEIARRFPGVRVVESRRGRGMQMNAGAHAASGSVLLFLHCDTSLPGGAIAELSALLASTPADFGAFRVRFEPSVMLPNFLAWLTRFAKPWCCFGDQGIFTTRDFFERTSGFEDIPLLEDVRWARRAFRLGRMVRSRRTAVTSARRFVEMGVTRQLWRDLRILVRERMGHDPCQLEMLYQAGYARGPILRSEDRAIGRPMQLDRPSVADRLL